MNIKKMSLEWTAFLIVLSSFFISLSSNANASKESVTMEFDIDASDAETALLEFAEQANLTLLVPFRLVNGIQTNSLHGRFSYLEGIVILLNGTGLKAIRLEQDAISIVKDEDHISSNSSVLPVEELGADNLAKVVSEEKEAPQIEVFEITGIRSSLAHAMENKRNAGSIQDGIAAEDVGKFPDQNVAESLQRLPGVAISRQNGEGSKLTIRGFGPEFNLVQVNGRTIATTGTDRSLDFQVLPSELIAGSDVVKAPMASIQEGSIGGYVNVKTARPKSSPGFKAVGSIHTKYSELSDDIGPRVSGIVSNTFMDNRFGVLIGFTHQENTNRIDSAETSRWSTVTASAIEGDIKDLNGNVITPEHLWYPGRYRFNLTEEHRERSGANVTIEFAQTDDIAHTVDFLYSDFKREELRQGMQIPLHRSGWRNVVASNNLTAIRGEKFGNHPLDGQFGESGEVSETIVFGYHLNAVVGNFTFDFDAFKSKADATIITHNYVPNLIDATQEIGNDVIKYDLVGGGNLLDYQSNIDISNTSNVRAHFNTLFDERLEDDVAELKFDARYETDEGTLTSIDTGVAYSSREKTLGHYRIQSGCGNKDVINPISTCNTFFDLDDSLFKTNDSHFLSEESGDFPRQFILVADVQKYLDAIGTLRQEPNWTDKFLSRPRSTATEEEKTSAYVQFNFKGELGDYTWSGNAGARYVDVETVSSGYGQNRIAIEHAVDKNDNSIQIDVLYSELSQISKKHRYDEVLPSVNFKLDFQNGYNLRFAGSKVISLPTISDISVSATYNDIRASNFSTVKGNPFLLPYEATQFDLSLEYYSENGDSYALNLFTKTLDSFISTQTTPDTTPNVYIDGKEVDASIDIPEFGPLVELVTQKSNRAGGDITGVELAFLHNFDYLPSVFDGFGIQANFTYLDAEDKNAEPIGIEGINDPGVALEGFSETSYNVVAFYEKDRIQARFAYNWRDDFLLARSGTRNGGLPEHVEAYGQLDASFSYDVTEDVTILFEAINITNERLYEYVDVQERLSRLQYTGSRFALGARVKL
ncbi:TonB-dependent receptor [Thalassotalea euphylliae]|nr:TonB-dependent receptor [Thalassotalea euphylliae]